jgi:hypothetical protein
MAVKVNRALVPTTGNFYLLSQSGTPMPPMPFDPYPGCQVYSLGNNNYAIDDRVVAAAKQALREMSPADEPGIPGNGGSTDGGSFSPMDTSYMTNGSLWIEITGVDSHICHKVTDTEAQGFGNFDKRAKGNFHVSSLNLADEVMVQIGFLRQFFLCQTGLLAVSPDGLTHDSTMMWPRQHWPLQKQAANQSSTQHNVFYS